MLRTVDLSVESQVTVSLPDTGKWPGAVRWYHTDNPVNAAPSEITDGHGWRARQSLNDLFARPPQRYNLIHRNPPPSGHHEWLPPPTERHHGRPTTA